MAEIIFTCPHCESEMETDASFAGNAAQCPGCNNTVLIPMPGIKEGIEIAGFKIEKRLGIGGMGEVWLATQTAMDRKVALKILSPALTQDEEFVTRFMAEVQLSAKLEHPNIVAAHYAGSENGIHYLAMSFIDGVELEDKLKIDKIINEKEALKITRSIAEALCYAWDDFQIIHRDIKPANIMIDRKGRARLMDMGISKSLSEDKNLTMTGMIVGTPYYMSPEQARADSDLDSRSDIYALGATLYHMATGEVPYDATTAMGILAKHITEEFPSPQLKNPELSDECSVLLEIMMAKKMENRQNDWQAVISDIDRVLANEFPLTPRPGMGESQVLQMTASQALSRRKVVTKPHKARQIGQSEVQEKSYEQETTSSSSKMPIIIGIATTALVLLILGGILLFFGQKKGGGELVSRSVGKAMEKAVPNDFNRPWIVKKPKIDLVPIKSGSFMMGIKVSVDPLYKQHRVKISRPFWMGKYEVTQEQYEKIMGRNPSIFQQFGKNAPVDRVPWGDAVDFCKKLTDKEQEHLPKGYVFRLPTEAEWEYCCRGGTETPLNSGDSEKNHGDYAWYKKNSLKHTHPVGRKKPNKWGLYDMHGNVMEWCLNWFGDYPKKSAVNPKGPENGKERVLRAGTIESAAHNDRSWSRHRHKPDIRGNEIGFRIVLAPKIKQSTSAGKLKSKIKTSEDLHKALKASNPDYNGKGRFDVEASDNSIFAVSLKNCPTVSDITCLKGLSLRLLTLCNTRVRDISSLKNQKLEYIYLPQYISDISVLENMPITQFYIRGRSRSKLKDLSPLKKMRLTNLKLDYCPEIVDIDIIKNSRLEILNLNGCKKIKNFTPLKGHPLKKLYLGFTQFSNKDMTLLRGMKLEDLSLLATSISDISVLAGMPLKFLRIDKCKNLKDLSSLKNCNQLETILLQPKYINKQSMEMLRKMKHLKFIGVIDQEQQQPAAEFWKKYDAGEYR